MQYSDTSTKSGLLQRCELYSGLGDTGITGSTYIKQVFTASLNHRLGMILTMILESQDSWDYDDINHTDFPIITTNLVANQADYSLPASEKILKIKRAEVLLDGVWRRATKMDINQDLNADTIYSTSNPFYDIQYNSVFIKPIPTDNVIGGLKLWVTIEPDWFNTSDTTQEPGIDEMFHEMLAVGASLDWAIAKGKNNKNDLYTMWTDWEKRLRDYYGNKEEQVLTNMNIYQDNYK